MQGPRASSSLRMPIEPELLEPTAASACQVTVKPLPAPATATPPISFSDELLSLLPFLRAFARSLTRHREMAEDLAQEALAKAWQSRASFVPGSNLKAWLFMIVRNQFYSDRRRAWRNQPWDDDVAGNVLISPSNQLAAVALSEVAAAIEVLPVLQQNAIILVGAGGLPYDEAAQICGCAVGTIKSRVARARRAIELAATGAVAVPISLRPPPGGAADAILCKLALITASVAIPATGLAAQRAARNLDAGITLLCPALRIAPDIGRPTILPPALFVD